MGQFGFNKGRGRWSAGVALVTHTRWSL